MVFRFNHPGYREKHNGYIGVTDFLVDCVSSVVYSSTTKLLIQFIYIDILSYRDHL